MKKTALLLFASALIVALLSFATAGANAAPRRSSLSEAEQLLDSRSALLFIKGRRVGDMVLGARAKLQFEFIDRKLADKIYSSPQEFPDEITANAQYTDRASRKKSTLVILVYFINKGWYFDPLKITVNGEPLTNDRFYQSILSKRIGNVYEGDHDALVFSIPKAISKPGMKVVFGYEDDSVEFIVPKN